MPELTIPELDDDVRAGLQRLADGHGRTATEEARPAPHAGSNVGQDGPPRKGCGGQCPPYIFGPWRSR
jgi:hypothetical protein